MRYKVARSSIAILQKMRHSSELGTMTHPPRTTSVSARYATTIEATYGWLKVKEVSPTPSWCALLMAR